MSTETNFENVEEKNTKENPEVEVFTSEVKNLDETNIATDIEKKTVKVEFFKLDYNSLSEELEKIVEQRKSFGKQHEELFLSYEGEKVINFIHNNMKGIILNAIKPTVNGVIIVRKDGVIFVSKTFFDAIKREKFITGDLRNETKFHLSNQVFLKKDDSFIVYESVFALSSRHVSRMAGLICNYLIKCDIRYIHEKTNDYVENHVTHCILSFSKQIM